MSTNYENSFDEFPLDQLANQGWVTWDHFFNQDELEKILQQSLQTWQSGAFKPAKVGRGDHQREQTSIRSDSTFWLDRQQPEWDWVLNKLDRFRVFLNQNLYLGLDDFEGHLARYDSGQKYDAHIDQSAHKSPLHGERVISFVLYLNRNWTANDGGQLCLHLNENQKLIEPIWGRVAVFRSDTITHAVLESKNVRWSLTGWFRRH